MLNHHHINNKIIWLTETDSTNHYATALLNDNPANETAIVAAYQTKGKGQRENKWESDDGKNILMSWICYPVLIKADELFYLNKVITMALIQFLKHQFNIDAKIKWPNDIYVGDKKIAGILIENAIQGQFIKHAIIGIGLNINQEHFSDVISHKTTSTKIITNKNFVVNEVIIHLLHQLHDSLEWLTTKRFQSLTDFYMKHLYRLNEEHYFKLNFEKVIGTIVGVNKQGKLIVLMNGEFKTFGNKEIEYVIPK
ncbi:MAG: hypothetical protein RIQ33_1892 [Bacteroidota bacterium]|jgi:BirA family biotin operon repressor/biotin-[acetyl-CoA-carboxylase] ligase